MNLSRTPTKQQLTPILPSPKNNKIQVANQVQSLITDFTNPSCFASPLAPRGNELNPSKKRGLQSPDCTASPSIEDKLAVTEDKLMAAIQATQSIILESNKQLIGEVKNEIGELRVASEAANNKIKSLASVQNTILLDINKMKQERLNNTIEIVGVSSALLSTESPHTVLTNLFSSLKISCDSACITKVDKFFITVGGAKKGILSVTLSSYDEKKRIMDLKSQSDKENRTPIFFNHALTPQNRAIYNKARVLAKKCSVKVKVAHGNIYIRKEGDTRGTPMHSIDDVTRFESSLTTKATKTANQATNPADK